MDGSVTPTVLWDKSKFDGIVSPSNIFVDDSHNKIYWTDEGSDEIIAANLDGTGTPVVLFDASDGVSRADGISADYDSKKIYWSSARNIR